VGGTGIPPTLVAAAWRQGRGGAAEKRAPAYAEGGRKVSFVLDTLNNERIAPFVKDSDLLVSEASFSSDLERLAHEYKHLTSKQAAEIAKKAKVKKLILAHLSQRYSNNPEKILNEAKKVFRNVSLARDLETTEI